MGIFLKFCNSCGKEKSLESFGKNSSKKDGLQTQCRECKRETQRKWYAKNRKVHYHNTKIKAIERIEENKRRLKDYLSNKKCTDCDNNDWRVFEFDHINADEKRDSVSRMLFGGYSWKTIMKEISKCEIVCANCHRVRTVERSEQWRMDR